jgi:hypothetical protein
VCACSACASGARCCLTTPTRSASTSAVQRVPVPGPGLGQGKGGCRLKSSECSCSCSPLLADLAFCGADLSLFERGVQAMLAPLCVSYAEQMQAMFMRRQPSISEKGDGYGRQVLCTHSHAHLSPMEVRPGSWVRGYREQPCPTSLVLCCLGRAPHTWRVTATLEHAGTPDAWAGVSLSDDHTCMSCK